MSDHNSTLSRRTLLGRAAAAGAGVLVPYVPTARAEERARPDGKNDRLRIGAVGLRYQGSVVARKALPYGDIVALCDVDRRIGDKARQEFGQQAELYEDYRAMLDRNDLDVLIIGTPDHWHTAMLIDACRAGVDVYCEKPLTLTIDEGKAICRVVRQTQRVVQVGSWQRSDHRFRLACEMVRQGRIGKLQRVDVVLGPNETGGPFSETQPPPHLNWNLWQGQTPAVPYIPERCHYAPTERFRAGTFRWWHEYSGGQMTDWGAHHLDIAQWAVGAQDSGPVAVEGSAQFPDIPNGYNVATRYQARYTYADGVEMTVRDSGRNGVMLTGSEGRIFVNRAVLAGKPVEDLRDRPLRREDFQLYADDNLERPARMGKLDAIVNHMGNFYDCLISRRQPVSNVFSQHRSVTVCHLGNIAMWLGRPVTWDPDSERFVQDKEADGLMRRPQRAGFTIDA